MDAEEILKEYKELFFELNDCSKPIGSIPNLKQKERRLLELKLLYESIKEEKK